MMLNICELLLDLGYMRQTASSPRACSSDVEFTNDGLLLPIPFGGTYGEKKKKAT